MVATELGHTEPLFETVLDLHGDGGPLAPQTVLRVAVVAPEEDGPALLHLRHRTDAIDADAAARIAGYHLTALEQLVGRSRHAPRRQPAVRPQELRPRSTASPDRSGSCPTQRFHELFEQRVAATPTPSRPSTRDRRWTYRELNARANRLARALLARGLRREGVVAVVAERNLDWMAAVLAIFKAGGVYLPIEPHFPAERIATTLTRAGCRLVLTEPGSDTMLRQALVTGCPTR